MQTRGDLTKAIEKLLRDQGSRSAEGEETGNGSSAGDYPAEPFACPVCGQMLAPSCRVCVACKSPIDPAQIAPPREMAPPVAPAAGREPAPAPVRYPWRIFFGILLISFSLALLTEGLWGKQRAQMIMAGIQTLAGMWVFFDALRQGIPKPLRWGLGSMLLPVVIFPWYLGRRDKPRAPVPFVEAEVGPVTRLILFAILLFFLISLVLYIAEGPRTGKTPVPRPKLQSPGDRVPSRITRLHLRNPPSA